MVEQQIHVKYSEPGWDPVTVEFRVLPDNVIFRVQQGAERKWYAYMNDQRPTGRIASLGTYDEDEYNEALFAASGAAEAYCAIANKPEQEEANRAEADPS